jgi:hypothetical protein
MQNDWSFVMTESCTNCVTKAYSFNESTTARIGNHSKGEIDIGSKDDNLVLKGFPAVDEMCIGKRGNTSSSCLPDFEFFAVNELSSSIFFDTVGGELGLGMDLPGNGLSFISSLYNASLIDQQIVAIHIETGNTTKNESYRSQVSIGGYLPQFIYYQNSSNNETKRLYFYGQNSRDKV